MRAPIRRAYSRIVDSLARRALRAMASDIELGVKMRAFASTCAYVEQHLATCMALASARDVLDFAVSECPKEGFLCEFGVFEGRTINHLARRLRPRPVHGFDSFEGLPEPWRTGFDRGAFRTRIPALESSVILHKGWFEDTLPEFVKALPEPRAALIHVDCDLYSSTRTVFKWLGGTIAAGTIVVFDEYFNYPGWRQHEHRALQEFCSESGKAFDYLAYNKTHEQVVVRFR